MEKFKAPHNKNARVEQVKLKTKYNLDGDEDDDDDNDNNDCKSDSLVRWWLSVW